MEINGIFSEAFWYIAPILVAFTTAFTGFINQLFKVKGSTAKQLISWAVGAASAVAAWGLGFIGFGEPVWLGVVCLSAVVGLSSNGIYDIKAIRNFINTWFSKLNYAKELQNKE